MWDLGGKLRGGISLSSPLRQEPGAIFGSFTLSFPFALPLAFPISGIVAVKTLLEFMELPRSGLDAEVLGDDTPSFSTTRRQNIVIDAPLELPAMVKP